MAKLKIGFCWFGMGGRYGFWKDGLYAAMKHIEQEHEVIYFEPTDDIPEVDIILFWEAACTYESPEHGEWYKKIQNHPGKKCLLFAGGPFQRHWFDGFDLIFTESTISEEEFEAHGLPYMRAFGINEEIMKPMNLPKQWDGFMQATFAGWKRQPLFGEALHHRGLLCGRFQDHEKWCYEKPIADGTSCLPEQTPEQVAQLINMSHTVVNTSEFWGGGQRCTLEAMSCGIPPIVMTDSPKNREYVEESGFGVIAEPNPDSIRHAIALAKHQDPQKGIDYINSKWTSKHYAANLLKGIEHVIKL